MRLAIHDAESFDMTRGLFLAAAFSFVYGMHYAVVAEADTASGNGAPQASASMGNSAENGSVIEGLPTQKRAWKVTSAISAGVTYTDNVNPSSSSSSTSDLVTQVSPSINVLANTSRLKGHLSYRFTEYFYQNSSPHSRSQNQLSASGNLELVENRMFVDMGGTISNQAASPFGVFPGSGYELNSNSVETRSYRISPYVRGHLWSGSNYELRYGITQTDTNSSSIGGSTTDYTSGTLASSVANTKLGWSVAYNKTNYKFSGRPEQDKYNTNLLAMVSYLIDPQLTVSAGVVENTTDFSQSGAGISSTGGTFAFDWRPTPRAVLSGNWQHQSFGNVYRLSASNRMRMSEIGYTFSQSLNTLPTMVGYVGLGTLYDLLYSNYASEIPDPTERASYVSGLLAYYGLDPNLQLYEQYLQTQVTLQRSHSLTFAKRGLRNVLTLSYRHSVNNSLLQLTSFVSDLSQVSRVTQDSFGISLSHLLGSQSNLNANYNYLISKGEGATAVDSRQHRLSVNYARSLGKKTNITAGISRTQYEGSNGVSSHQNTISAFANHTF